MQSRLFLCNARWKKKNRGAGLRSINSPQIIIIIESLPEILFWFKTIHLCSQCSTYSHFRLTFLASTCWLGTKCQPNQSSLWSLQGSTSRGHCCCDRKACAVIIPVRWFTGRSRQTSYQDPLDGFRSKTHLVNQQKRTILRAHCCPISHSFLREVTEWDQKYRKRSPQHWRF